LEVQIRQWFIIRRRWMVQRRLQNYCESIYLNKFMKNLPHSLLFRGVACPEIWGGYCDILWHVSQLAIEMHQSLRKLCPGILILLWLRRHRGGATTTEATSTTTSQRTSTINRASNVTATSSIMSSAKVCLTITAWSNYKNATFIAPPAFPQPFSCKYPGHPCENGTRSLKDGCLLWYDVEWKQLWALELSTTPPKVPVAPKPSTTTGHSPTNSAPAPVVADKDTGLIAYRVNRRKWRHIVVTLIAHNSSNDSSGCMCQDSSVWSFTENECHAKWSADASFMRDYILSQVPDTTTTTVPRKVFDRGKDLDKLDLSPTWNPILLSITSQT